MHGDHLIGQRREGGLVRLLMLDRDKDIRPVRRSLDIVSSWLPRKYFAPVFVTAAAPPYQRAKTPLGRCRSSIKQLRAVVRRAGSISG
jgi:hypothetical protein